MSAPARPHGSAAAWHDAEHGSYAADMALWERLASELGGPVLDLGAGTGRVAIHLAARGHDVVAVDSDDALLEVLRLRAEERGLPVRVVEADVRELDLEATFPLVLAPMQLMHMLEGAAGRRAALAALARVLAPGGVIAVAVLAEPLPPSGPTEPIPDVREDDGWIHSSLPLEVRVGEETLEIVRLRQLVSPGGALSEETHVTTVDRLRPGVFEVDVEACGLRILASQPIAETEEHVGALVHLIEHAKDRLG
jgi:SAM-dependent methyltransferase